MNKLKKGEIVTGYVTGIEKYGIFINIDDKHDGLIHISEISSTYVRNIHDYVKIGECIQARIIEDETNRQLKLSIKDLDYRISRGQNAKIIETRSGFSTLESKLNYWIEEKLKEILKKKQKNKKKHWQKKQ